MNYSIPEEIVGGNFKEDDINILIGENGSGKSTMLFNILRYYALSNVNTIAIANSIHDKFNFTNTKVNLLKSNRGRSIVKNILFNSLLNFSDRETVHYRNISTILKYARYNSRIGFKVDFVLKNLKNRELLDSLTKEEEELLHFILDRYIYSRKYKDDIIWIDFSQKSFDDLVDSYFIQIFKFYKNFEKLIS